MVCRRECLIGIETTPHPPLDPLVRTFDLHWCEEGDIDAVATAKLWKDEPSTAPGKIEDEFMLGYINPVLAPHLHAANDRWPATVPLPEISSFRRSFALELEDSPGKKDGKNTLTLSPGSSVPSVVGSAASSTSVG